MKKRTPLTREEWRSVSANIEAAKLSLDLAFWKLNGRVPTRTMDMANRKLREIDDFRLKLETVACDQLGEDEGMQAMSTDKAASSI